MGAYNSCKIFETLNTALKWASIHKLMFPHIAHILDDVLVVFKGEKNSNLLLRKFIVMCKSVVIPISKEKTFFASQVMEYKGITLNSMTSEASLPEDKVEKCK